MAAQPTPEQQGATYIVELPPMVRRAYDEIASMLRILRSSRDALEQTTTEKLHLTSAKIEEVTSATEVAATGMLDGLDRALGLVDQLEELDESGNARATETRSQLRDELFQSINHLQFQDITTQQLNYASSILMEVERRLAEIARSFDPRSVDVPGLSPETSAPSIEPVGIATFDPNASLRDAERRQAIADEILLRFD